MRETLSSSSSSSTIETKRVSQMLSAAITHRTEQNRTHGIFRLQPPRATERERERDSSKSGRNSCAARREHKCKESALALRSYPVLPFHALFHAPAVPLARNSCIASRQISIICQTALTLEVSLSLTGRQKQVAGACGLSSNRNCVLLSGILIQIPFRFIGNSIRFDFIAKLSEFVFCKIKFAVHCLHIDRTTLLPISSSFPLTQILSKLSIVQSAHTHSRTHTQIQMYPYRLRNSHV